MTSHWGKSIATIISMQLSDLDYPLQDRVKNMQGHSDHRLSMLLDFLPQLFNSCIINVKLNFWFPQLGENFFLKLCYDCLVRCHWRFVTHFESNFLAWLEFEINLIISSLSLHKATNSVSLWPSDGRSLLFQFPSQLRFDSTSWRELVLLSYSCEILKKILDSISFCNK